MTTDDAVGPESSSLDSRRVSVVPADEVLLPAATAAARWIGDNQRACALALERLMQSWKGPFPPAYASALQRMHETFADGMRMRDKVSAYLAEEMRRLVGEQARSFAALADLIGPTSDMVAETLKQLRSATFPSAAVLAAMRDQTTAVLAGLDVRPVVGALSWLDKNLDVPPIRSAALQVPVREVGPTRPLIRIEASVECALCGALMLQGDESVEMVSDALTIDLHLQVLPVCPECRRELRDDYFLELLRILRRPRLELIRGEGEDPAAPNRSHLRLVTLEHDEEPKE